MPSSLALLSCSESRGSDLKLAKLAEMMGVGVATFEATDAQRAEDLLAAVRGQGHRTVAARSETLARLKCQSGPSAASLLEGFEPSTHSYTVLKSLDAVIWQRG